MIHCIAYFLNTLFSDLIASRLPPVPEEHQSHSTTQTVNWAYLDNALPQQNETLHVSYCNSNLRDQRMMSYTLQVNAIASPTATHQYQLIQLHQQDIKPVQIQDTRQQQLNQQIIQPSSQFSELLLQPSLNRYLQQQQEHQNVLGGTANVSEPISYTTVISKSNSKPTLKNPISSRVKHQQPNNMIYNSKSLDNLYTTYSGTPQQNVQGQNIERISKYYLQILFQNNYFLYFHENVLASQTFEIRRSIHLLARELGNIFIDTTIFSVTNSHMADSLTIIKILVYHNNQ